MDFQASKIELAKLILSIDDQKIIDKIITLIKSEESDFWNDLSAKDKKEIKKAIEQLDAGEKTSIRDFLKKVS